MNIRAILSGLFTLFLMSCGKGPATGPTPPVVPVPQPGDGAAVTLMVYGAHWCPNCKQELPDLQNLLNQTLGDQASRVKLQLWVPTGRTAGQRPTPEIAEEYRQKVGLNASVHVDEWHWKNFKALFPGVAPALPAGVLFDKDGNVIKKFPPGADSFIPANVVAAAAQALTP